MVVFCDFVLTMRTFYRDSFIQEFFTATFSPEIRDYILLLLLFSYYILMDYHK